MPILYYRVMDVEVVNLVMVGFRAVDDLTISIAEAVRTIINTLILIPAKRFLVSIAFVYFMNPFSYPYTN